MKLYFLILISVLLLACSNSEERDINNLVYRPKSNNQPNILTTDEIESYQNRIFTEKDFLYSTYKRWEGTPYLWGGETRFGIDCSSFMQKLFKEIYTMNIPRTTTEQMVEGNNPGYKNRQLGDLIFFKTSPETFHVGIYYENDNFFHASSTFGVTMSNLNESFWKKTYLKIRRLR